MTFRPPGPYFQANMFGGGPDLSTPEGLQEAIDQKLVDLRSRWEGQVLNERTLAAIKAEIMEVLHWVNDLRPPQDFLVRVDVKNHHDVSIQVLPAEMCLSCNGEGTRKVRETEWDDDVHLGTFTSRSACPICNGEGKVPA